MENFFTQSTRPSIGRRASQYGLLSLCALLSACGGNNSSTVAAAPPTTALSCDSSMIANFKPDAYTTVTLVKAFNKGDPLALSGTPTTPTPATATTDLCLVKLNIGPGNPGPAGAPSTSAGIGVEVWLPSPATWNTRLHLMALGGFGGSPAISSTTLIADAGALATAMSEGAVSAVNDGGHSDAAGTAAFAMKPDGSINTTLWTDYSARATHEMTLKVKALAAAYYLKPHKYAYLEGCSAGGRQGLQEAQTYPTDFDGIVAGAPSINQTQFGPADLYPALVAQRDLGGVQLTTAQQALVTGAAVSACDSTLNGQHDGFISNPESCTYDPTRDAAVLCTTSGGSNSSSSCISMVQATAMNKIWYGPTIDGTVPSPDVDNGVNIFRSPRQVWWGTPRGASLARILNFTLSKDQTALNMQNASYAGTNFINATGNGQDAWKNLSYLAYADVFKLGAELNKYFGYTDTDNPDLSGFKNAGGKMITYHGLADQLVSSRSSINYYNRASSLLGGYNVMQNFNKLYLIPGMGHCSGIGSANGTSSSAANPPLPATGQFYKQLTNWVENSSPPTNIVITTTDAAITRPLCVYPAKQTYTGGNVSLATSYACK